MANVLAVRKMRIQFAILCFVAGIPFHARAGDLALSPDLSELQESVITTVTQRWGSVHAHDYHPPKGWEGIRGVEIREVRRVDELLKPEPAHPHKVSTNGVFLVHAICEANWWKESTENVIVMVSTNGNFRTLLHFDGGGNWKGLDFRVQKTGSSGSLPALIVEDHGCGNQMSRTIVHTFRWNPERDRFDEKKQEKDGQQPDQPYKK